MEFDKRVIIFGVGDKFKKSIAAYIAEKYDNILCIVDNDKGKWGEEISGYVINNPDYIAKYLDEEDVAVVIATFRYHDEISAQLIEQGWGKEKIIIAADCYPLFRSIEFEAYLHDVDLNNPVPTVLNIELSGKCNCRCVYCPFHGEPNLKEGQKGFMEWKTMDAVIDLIKKIPTIETVDTTGPGEIFLNKQWFEMLEKLLMNTNIKHVIMYTNGMLLTEDNVKKIALLSAEDVQIEVSIDGESPEENDEYRLGSKYNIVRDNIYRAKRFLEENVRGKVNLLITNCYPATMAEIEKSNYKLDSKCNFAPRFLKEDFDGIKIASQKTFYCGKGMLSKFDIVEIEWPENVNGRCVNLFYRLPINYKGELLRCSCGYAGVEGIGSIFTDDILELWHHEKLIEQARNNFLKGALEDDFCTGCPGKREGKYNILIRK